MAAEDDYNLEPILSLFRIMMDVGCDVTEMAGELAGDEMEVSEGWSECRATEMKLCMVAGIGEICRDSHWVQALDDEDLGRLDGLGRVQQAGDVVVDGLLDGLALLERLHLLVHEIEVVGAGVQRRHGLLLAPVPVQGVVVVQADDSGGVADQRVGVGVAAPGRRRGAPEHGRQPAHERGLAAPGISRQPDHHSLALGALAHHHRAPGLRH
jgi:hypothetical protein